MSWEAVQWANKQRLRLPQEQLLLLLLANAADPDGVAFRWWRKREHWWTYLVAHSRQSRASVFRHLNTLEESGLARREATISDDGEKRFFVNLNLDVFVDVDSEDINPPLEDQSHDETQYQSNGATESVSPVRPAQSQSCDSIESPIQNPKDERERARARGLLDFKKKYPSSAFDDIAKIDHEWNQLPDNDWPKAVPFIEAYFAGLKKLKRSHVPAAWRYLRDRPWGIVADQPQPEKYYNFSAFSKEWWAELFFRADNGDKLGWHIDWAIGGNKFCVKASAMPSDDLIAALRPFRANGPEITAWRPWLLARGGGSLPRWTESFWVFLPSPEPPVAGTPALRTTGPPVAA